MSIFRVTITVALSLFVVSAIGGAMAGNYKAQKILTPIAALHGVALVGIALFAIWTL